MIFFLFPISHPQNHVDRSERQHPWSFLDSYAPPNLLKPACTAHIAEILEKRPGTATALVCAWRQRMGKRK
jgi:hypothetical protein